jgi:TctA family transporter
MDAFVGLGEALSQLATLSVIGAFLIGVANGLFFGLLPGLSGSVGIALMIPLAYGIGATQAIALFAAALSGQTFAGSIAAILLNTPGTSPNAATTFDGYPMTRAGRGGFAIGISATASAIGTLVGTLVIIALFPVVRSVILAFSFPEFTMLGVLGIAAIALASRGSQLKGLMSGAIGLLLSFVGFAPIGGDLRYVFGYRPLVSGVDVVATLIGLFAISEVIRLLLRRTTIAEKLDRLSFSKRQVWQGVRYTLGQPWLLVRSSALGTAIGMVPGVGGTVASFLAYFQAARTSKDAEGFGHGDPRGVLAPEAANDGKDAGSALPSLAFGLPGSSDWAIILGAMIVFGIQPGPNLIREHPDIVWVAILTILFASFVTSGIGLFAAPYLVQVSRVRSSVLAPVVAVLAVTGAYGLEQQPVDVYVAVLFGLLGYAMRQTNVPLVPLILGLILGEPMERAFQQTLSVFGGPAAFVTRPLSLALVLVTVGMIAFEVRASVRRRREGGAAVEEALDKATRPASLVLVGLFGLVGLGAALLALGFGESSQAFPVISGLLLIVFALVYLLVAAVPVLRQTFGGLIADTGVMEQTARREVDGQEPVGDAAGGGGAGPAAAASAGDTEVAPQRADTATAVVTPRRLRLVIALVVLIAVGTWAFGVAVVLPLFLVLTLRVVGGERWLVTGLVTVGTLIFLYVVFVQILRVPIEGGALLPL